MWGPPVGEGRGKNGKRFGWNPCWAVGSFSGWAKTVPRGLSSLFLFSFPFLFCFLLIFGLKNFYKASDLKMANF
jgi:hypothetical protein